MDLKFKHKAIIYNLQIIFVDLKNIVGDTWAFTIYNLQIIFDDLKKSLVKLMQLQFSNNKT
jgi:hypothetical protein